MYVNLYERVFDNFSIVTAEATPFIYHMDGRGEAERAHEENRPQPFRVSSFAGKHTATLVGGYPRRLSSADQARWHVP